MKHIFLYGSYSYEYYIEFSDRKTLGLEILPDLTIITKVPSGTGLVEIEEFMVRKWRWLEKQLTQQRKLKKTRHERQYVSGESYYYLGRQYMLLVESGDDIVKLERGKLRIYTSKDLRNSDHNKKLLDGWYARRRDAIFKQEFLRASKLFNFDQIPQLGQRIMAKRWGSHKSDGKVLLNPRLIEAPREAVFYVCLHELCHVDNKKHDQAFYNELEKRMPNWREVKERLEIRFG